jgi:hypothetical protein
MTSLMSDMDAQLAALKTLLEAAGDKEFEKLAADLFSRLIGDIAVAVSKPGSQFGGDAGTAGLRGRHLRLECKRYRETTHLSPRSLAGEVIEAVRADPWLEAWVLAATKTVSETERNLARDQGELLGLTIVVIDWTPPAAGVGINALAALCATWPDVVKKHVGSKAADAAKTLAPYIGAAVDNLRKDLATWNIGFRSLRKSSLEQLELIWRSSAESWAALNQDAAGGQSGIHLIERRKPLDQLEHWWTTAPDLGISPAVVVGAEGVGKTWVALNWLNRKSADLPIVLMLPSSTFVSTTDVSEAGVRDLLGRSVRLLTKSGQSTEYWRRRIDRLLTRPESEGPAFLLVVDGLNQQPFARWSALAQTLQVKALEGRVRLLSTSRKQYFREDIARFGKLSACPTEVEIGPYSDIELQELCRLHGLDITKMSQQLRNLVATPRLFPLVVRLKDSDALQSESTVLRLLFEYGKDVFAVRQQSALTGDAWTEWLTESAKRFRNRVSQAGKLSVPESRSELSQSLGAAHITVEDVARRLSDVIEGGFYERKTTPAGSTFVLREEPTLLGLGLALLETLWSVEGGFDIVRAEALKWLEPIVAIDLVSAVVRAALAVLCATEQPPRAVTDVLMVLWMNGQNPSSNFELDAFAFGDAFPLSMLTVVEHSTLNSQNVAFHYAVQSVRRLPRARTADWGDVLARMVDWASWTNIPRPEQVADTNHYAKRHQEQLLKRLGKAQIGVAVVLGEALKFEYSHSGDPSVAIPGIMEGHELVSFMPVFARAAVREAVNVGVGSKCWDGLRWVVMLACQHPQEVRQQLEQLANGFLTREPERGVEKGLRNRVAASLLRLTGDELLEIRAMKINETYGLAWDYHKDYLADPGDSFFPLERRHVESVLGRQDMTPWRRLDRLRILLAADPATELPDDLREYQVKALAAQTFEQIDTHGQRTVESHNLERLASPAARFLPVELSQMRRRHLVALASRDGAGKKWAAQAAPEFLLVADAAICEQFSYLRSRSVNPNEDTWANTFALEMELLHKPIPEQLSTLLVATDYHFTESLLDVLRPATSAQLATFLSNSGEARQRAVLIVFRVMASQRTREADMLAQELAGYLTSDVEDLKDAAFTALGVCAPEVAGRTLLAASWEVDQAHPAEAHYGSLAVAAATRHLPLTDVLCMVVPWLWLETAKIRGNVPTELQQASLGLLVLLKVPPGSLPNFEGVVSVRMPSATDELAYLTIAESGDNNRSISDFFDQLARSPEEVAKRMQELAKNAYSTLQNARSSGYGLYMQTFSYDTVEAAYLAAPSEWGLLMEGADIASKDFIGRLHAAEGLYLALCEVLLRHVPDKGLTMWLALLGRFRIRFNGHAGIPELVHIAFRVPESVHVLQAREVLTAIGYCNTDEDCMDLVIAAQLHGCNAWLDRLITEDGSSPLFWRKKRGIVLRALRESPPLDALRWPEGELVGSWKALQANMQRWSIRNTLTKYWWQQFQAATDVEHAYAAWEVFSTLADRRRHLELSARLAPVSELDRLRGLHIGTNWQNLQRKIDKCESDSPSFTGHLFGLEKPCKWLMLDGQLPR